MLMTSVQIDWIARAQAVLRTNRIGGSLAFGAQGLLFATLLTHVPQFKREYHLGDGGITIMILVVSVIAGGGSVAAEQLAHRYSSRVTLQLGLAWIALSALGIASAPNRVSFLLAFGVYGLGLGAVDASTNMQAVAIQARYGRSILTSFHAGWSAGAILGAVYVAGSERIDLALGWSIAVPALLVLALAIVEGRLLLRADRGQGSGPTQRTIPWRPVLLLGAAMICFYVTDAGAGSWATTYAHDVLKASDSLAPIAFAAYQATGLLSRLAGDHVVRRIGVEPTVRIGSVIGTVGLVLAIVAPGPALAIVGFGIAGIGLPVVAPLCFSACGRLAPGHADHVVARVNVFNYLGSIVGGVAVGGVGTASSLRYGFIVPAVLALTLLLLAGAFNPKPVIA
jgi:MFS family permease